MGARALLVAPGAAQGDDETLAGDGDVAGVEADDSEERLSYSRESACWPLPATI